MNADEIAALQKTAADPRNSVWVAANAGSGKTKVLVDRLLRLLLLGVPPDRILCLTYTKAAAAEMTQRLQKTLNQWAVIPQENLLNALQVTLGDDFSAESINKARNLFFRFNDAIPKMRILTIHAFSQDLLRNFPLEAKLNPAFQLADDEQLRQLKQAAKTEILRKASANPESELAQMMDFLIDNLGEYSFNQWLNHINSSRHKTLQILQNEQQTNKAINGLYAKNELNKSDDWQSLLHKIIPINQDSLEYLRQIAQILAQGSTNDIKLAQKISNYIANYNSAENLHEFALAILTADFRQPAKIATKATQNLLQKSPKLWAELELLFNRAQKYLEHYYLLQYTKLSNALMLVGHHWFVHYQNAKSQSGLVDYSDLLELAHELLQNPQNSDWVLYKMDGKIEHLLIDEAQDTSGLQWKITELLTQEFFAGQGAKNGARSLFVVGDEKQSIYGFQGAQPQEFVLQADIYAQKAAAINHDFIRVPLQISFRSVEAILQLTDIIFSDDDLRVKVTNDKNLIHSTFRKSQNGRICLYSSE